MNARTLPYSRGHAAGRTGPQHAVSEDQTRILDGSHPGVAVQGRGCIYMVCDGVSSAPRGREAAALMCARIDSFYDRFHQPAADSIVQIVSEADWELREWGRGQAACTLSLLWLAFGQAVVMHVGDSQVYRVRHGEVTRITETHKTGRSLGAYVGMGPKVADVMHVWRDTLFEGDLFLMVTDGVTEVIPADLLLDSWWATQGSPQRAANAIIQEVILRGGTDDATALVVDVLGVETDLDFDPGRTFGPRSSISNPPSGRGRF